MTILTLYLQILSILNYPQHANRSNIHFLAKNFENVTHYWNFYLLPHDIINKTFKYYLKSLDTHDPRSYSNFIETYRTMLGTSKGQSPESYAKIQKIIGQFKDHSYFKQLDKDNLTISDDKLYLEKNIFIASLNGDLTSVAFLVDTDKSFVNLINKEDNVNPLFCATIANQKFTMAYLLEKGAFIEYASYENYTPLIKAAECGNLQIVKLLVKNGANIEATDILGQTPLFKAVKNGHEAVVSYLISINASVNFETKEKETPLHVAILNHNENIIATLLDASAQTDITLDREGNSLLFYAVKNEDSSIIKAFMKVKKQFQIDYDGFETPLLYAIRNKSNLTALLISWGIFNNVPDRLYTEYPLHYALKFKNLNILKELLKAGSDINCKNWKGKTPLMEASSMGFTEAVELILNHNPNINEKSNKGRTALMYSLKYNHTKIAELLIHHNSDLKERDNMNSCILHYATGTQLSTFLFIISRGSFNIKNLVNNNDETLYHFAAKSGSLDIMNYLENNGQSPYNITKQHRNSLHYAAESGKIDVIKHIISLNKFDINSVDLESKTPLMLAAYHGHYEATLFLIFQGADPSAISNNGYNVLDYIVLSGNIELAKSLIKDINPSPFLLNNTLISKSIEMTNFIITEFHFELNDRINILKTIMKSKNLLKFYHFVDDTDFTIFYTQLIIPAIRLNRLDILEYIMNEKKVISSISRTKGNRLIFHNFIFPYAMEKGNVNIVNYLLKVLHPELNETIMFNATRSGNVELIRYVFDIFHNVDIEDEEHKTPLYYAISSDNLDAVKFFVSNGASLYHEDVNYLTPLIHASIHSTPEIIEYLIEQKSLVNYHNPLGLTPLIAAVKSNTDCIDVLLQNGAIIDQADAYGRTPLYHAVYIGNLEIVKLLISKGANKFVKNNNGESLLHCAVRSQFFEMVQYLLSEGIEIDTKDNDGTTPLHLACELGYNQMVFYLVDKGADPLATDNQRNNCMHIVCKRNNEVLIKYFYKMGFSFLSRNKFGETPLHKLNKKLKHIININYQLPIVDIDSIEPESIK